MIEVLVFALGALTVAFAFFDFLRTTISLDGLGFISHRIARALWKTGGRLVIAAERRGRPSLRGLLGPGILTAIAGTWIALHLLGYTLMYLAGASLVSAQSGDPANLVQTVAFTGSALSTLGASTAKVTNGWWDVLSMVAAVNGMVVLTLAVSFILDILQTTTTMRSFAARYHALVRKDRSDPDSTLRHIAPLGPDLCGVAVKLTASPLPGVFVPDDPALNFADTVKAICRLLDNRNPAAHDADPHIAQLHQGLILLGRRMKDCEDRDDLAAARAWADGHTLPDRPAKRRA
ncbi:hypothetical protein OCGS_0600 [Oceaniovalibus guishaninsula JLT2003]|uniref:Potassium channel domain-containing protein n=1 Tax=Oceaniovalibus guishaninsula JLT2003 TaxID=1231392 RepID=K2I939_9RHOB|nr:hypothetical protein [Oceaniovalibus guishaninsula]EKE45510.1 hypothetical protein OCGS_0600 [Oceaniovalibus guishaninsula JLT2003]